MNKQLITTLLTLLICVPKLAQYAEFPVYDVDRLYKVILTILLGHVVKHGLYMVSRWYIVLQKMRLT